MKIQECICPRCGGRIEGEGLCSRCRADATSWITFDSRVISIHCPSCDAQKNRNTWTDTQRSREEIAEEIVRGGIHLHPDLKKVSVDIRIRDRTQNRSNAVVTVRGSLYGEDVESTGNIEIAWQKEQCDRCNRISGNYYEGVVQVRAQGRLLMPHEIMIATQIADEVEGAMQTSGDRLSYISDIDETRDGVDITIGSQQIGAALSQAIVQRLGGRYTTHPKLVGEKAGRKLYRVTYSVRLPRYVRGDVIRVGEDYGQVMQVEGQGIRYVNLKNGAIRSSKEDEVDRLIGNTRDARDALIAYVDGDILGLIDPDSGENLECPMGPWKTATAGQYIRVLKDRGHIVVVG